MDRINNKKTGLVLSVGAAKGLAHVGVIKALVKHGMKFDLITGSSMGSLVGACYAAAGRIDEVERQFLEMDIMKLLHLIDPKFSLMSKGLISGDKVKEFLKTMIGDKEFKDLKIPLVVTATDLNTAEEFIFDKGSVVEAVRASISMPAIFVPAKVNGRLYIDGASTNPLPIEIAKEKGAEYVVVSNIAPAALLGASKSGYRRNISYAGRNPLKILWKKLMRARKKHDDGVPDMLVTLMQAMHIMEYGIIKDKLSQADMIITPDSGEIDDIDFSKIKKAIEIGVAAAEKELNKKSGRPGENNN